jgi:hypothetical protein
VVCSLLLSQEDWIAPWEGGFSKSLFLVMSSLVIGPVPLSVCSSQEPAWNTQNLRAEDLWEEDDTQYSEPSLLGCHLF